MLGLGFAVRGWPGGEDNPKIESMQEGRDRWFFSLRLPIRIFGVPHQCRHMTLRSPNHAPSQRVCTSPCNNCLAARQPAQHQKQHPPPNPLPEPGFPPHPLLNLQAPKHRYCPPLRGKSNVPPHQLSLCC